MMSQPRSWPLSQTANKSSGNCSVCLAVCQLLKKDGTVHRHGPRSQPCPGSAKPPLGGAANTPTAEDTTATNSRNDRTTEDPSSPASSAAATTINVDSGNSYQLQSFIFNSRVIKRIPKSARTACAGLSSGRYTQTGFCQSKQFGQLDCPIVLEPFCLAAAKKSWKEAQYCLNYKEAHIIICHRPWS